MKVLDKYPSFHTRIICEHFKLIVFRVLISRDRALSWRCQLYNIIADLEWRNCPFRHEHMSTVKLWSVNCFS